MRGAIARLRDIAAADSAQWLRWLQDEELLGLMDMAGPVSEATHREFLRTAVDENRNARWFAIDYEGQFVGKVWLWDINQRHRRAEVRILIGERTAWGRGVGSDALATVANVAFAALELHKLYAYVHQRNERSRRAFLKAGFVEEALLRDEALWEGRYQNVSRFALVAGDQM